MSYTPPKITTVPHTKEKGIRKRPPVIVIMGHIDHGKSTLLDYIRKSNTVAKETGGITQHMGAYQTLYTDKAGIVHTLTFLDTPGHGAFRTIRERGAKAADLAVLVISGEDGVKPQTLEALTCIRDERIPFVVAINKIDRPNVDVERIKGSLAEHEIYVEGYGGDVPVVAISALTGEGVPELLEMLMLMAEMQNFTGDATKAAEGVVIEAHMDNKKGTTATLVIKDGTLSVGDVVVSGNSFSPVRSIEDYTGTHIKEAPYGSPVRIVGWNKVPVVGMTFGTVGTKKEAEAIIAREPARKKRADNVAGETTPVNTVIVPVVIKADTVGSLDAVTHEIEKIKIEGVFIKILLASLGTITENDARTASSGTNAVIVGFNSKIDASAKALAERQKIPVMNFDIIYRLAEWLAEECEKRRPRVETEEETGRAKILKVFSSEKDRHVIGGRVDSGSLHNGNTIKIMRRDIEIARGKIKSLQQQKLKVEEVGKDKEFGAMIESKVEPAPGDRLEAFTITTK